MPVFPDPTMEKQHAAAQAANVLRTEYRKLICGGVLTATLVIADAVEVSNAAARALLLRDILSDQRGVNKPQALARLRRLAATLEIADDLSDATINWLLDRRAGGRRLLAWLDAEHRREPPWPGFPWTPDPSTGNGT